MPILADADYGIHVGMSVLMTVGGLIVGLLAWVIKGLIARLEKAEDRVSGHATEIEVLKRSALGSKVEDHEARLKVIEGGMADMRADIKICVQELKHVSDLLEKGHR